jgi:hypothetical protein
MIIFISENFCRPLDKRLHYKLEQKSHDFQPENDNESMTNLRETGQRLAHESQRAASIARRGRKSSTAVAYLQVARRFHVNRCRSVSQIDDIRGRRVSVPHSRRRLSSVHPERRRRRAKAVDEARLEGRTLADRCHTEQLHGLAATQQHGLVVGRGPIDPAH